MSTILNLEIKQEDNINTASDENVLLNNDVSGMIKRELNEITVSGDSHVYSNDYRCAHCDYATNNKFYLKRHVLIHKISKDLKCAQCDYATNNKSHLKRHVLTYKVWKDIKCGQWDSATNNKYHFQSRLLRHKNSKLFKCGQCDYAAYDKALLKQHLLTHKISQDLQCAQCDYATNIKNLFKSHLLKHSTSTLDIDTKHKNLNSVDTPDIIEPIDAIEKVFNILNFIKEEEFDTAEPIFSPLDVPAFLLASSDDSVTKQTRKRKIKTHASDDEDYMSPPSYHRIFGSHRKLASNSGCESTSSRRGPPPKKYSKNYWYREMRVKNNEASRKSRLKRKLKQSTLVDEAIELLEKNIKLKAQVGELEKTVNNFRTNLMQILLKK